MLVPENVVRNQNRPHAPIHIQIKTGHTFLYTFYKSKQATRSYTHFTNTEMRLNLIRPTAMAQESHSLPFSRIKTFLAKQINFLAKTHTSSRSCGC